MKFGFVWITLDDVETGWLNRIKTDLDEFKHNGPTCTKVILG
jgi:hypothetical protein